MSIQHLEKPLKSYREPSLKKKLLEYQISTEKTPERREKKKKKEIFNSYKYIWELRVNYFMIWSMSDWL